MSQVQCPKCSSIYDNSLTSSCPKCAQEDLWGGIGHTKLVDQGGNGRIDMGGDGKTMPYDFNNATPTRPVGAVPSQETGSETKIYNPLGQGMSGTGSTIVVDKPVQPVVGWLVCVKGQDKGKSFEIHYARNFIGRGDKMDVVLTDPSVSREVHAEVIYEPRSKKFLMSNGTSRQMSYLNGNLLTTTAELNAYDELNLGDTFLKFIPFCGANFSWE